MSIQRIRIALNQTEWAALASLAQAELRPLEYQARFILRHELERLGLVDEDNGIDQSRGRETKQCGDRWCTRSCAAT